MLFAFENLYRHYAQCRRTKRNTHNALRFEVRQELNLLELQAALQGRTYRPGPSVCFVTKRPKLREIFAADFRDRIVHHLLVDDLERYWERVFIHDTHACRKGRGVHLAVDRLQGFMRQVTANGQRRAWYLQLDIRNYFMSIDKALLWRLLEPRIDNSDARWLTELLVFHDCTQDYLYKGRPGELERVPPHKTLLRAEPGKGLPIGNLNSQFFANVYLNGLDQFVKHELKCPYYLRYCDDFVLLSPDPDQLSEWRERIREYLWTERLLRLNPTRERLRPLSDGVDFLGYIVRRDYRLVRRRVVNALKARLRDARERLVSVREGVAWYRFDAPELERLRAVLASYLGHFRFANSWRLWQGIRAAHPWLGVYFEWDEAARKLQPRDAMPKALTRACQQYAWARGRFPGDALLFQVGAFYEVYDRRDAVLARDLGLRALRDNPRHALYGFPERLFGRYLSRLLELGRPVVVVAQGEHAWTGVRERRLAWRIVPAASNEPGSQGR